MAERESLSTVMAAWAQVVSALVGVIAAAAAVVVGLLTIQQGRTQQTLQFFASFNAPDMLQTREALDNEDWCHRYYPDEFPDPNYQRVATGQHIVSVVDFFDAVHNSCPPPEAGRIAVCDRAFAETLFRPYAADLYDNLSKVIQERRQQRGSEGFGRGMAEFAHETAPIEEVVARYAEDSCGITASR